MDGERRCLHAVDATACTGCTRRHGAIRRRIVVVIVVDLIITMMEGIGAYTSGGTALWVNALVGLSDAALLTLNWWGMAHEANGSARTARRIRWWSDAAFLIGYVMIGLWAMVRLVDQTNESVHGPTILWIACLATGVNVLCARACESSFAGENARSARRKLMTGAAVALVTVVNGMLVSWTGIARFDAIATVVIGSIVVTVTAMQLIDD